MQLILIVALSIAIVGSVYEGIRGKRFTAAGTLHIRPNSSANLRSNLSSLVSEDENSRIETDVALLRSETLLLSVASKLDLVDKPQFMGARGKYLHGDLGNPAVREDVVKRMQDNLSTHREPRTELIDVTFVSRSPELSAAVVNAVMTEYIQTTFQARYSSTGQVVSWLDGQLDDLRKQVETTQSKMVSMQKNLGVFSLDVQHNLLVAQLEQLTNNAATATAQRIANEARYRVLSSVSPDQIASGPTLLGTDGMTSLLGSLRERRSNVAAALAEQEPVFGAQYPSVKRLRSELAELDKTIAAEEKRVLSQSQSALSASQMTERQALSALQSKSDDIYGMRDKIVEYELLQQQFNSSRTLYESLLTRLREAGIEAGLEGAEIDIVNLARLPSEPSSRGILSAFALCLVVGLFLSVTLVLSVDLIDRSPRGIEDMQTFLAGVPALVIVPLVNLPRAKPIQPTNSMPYAISHPQSQFAEAFYALRTSILLSQPERPPKVILVSSGRPGEGKSTVATNLAAVLSQHDSAVLYIDADLRRPVGHKRFAVARDQGLTDYLVGRCTRQDVLKSVPDLLNLRIITSGPVPPQASSLLDSNRLQALMSELQPDFDFIVIDSPPVLSVIDAVILSKFADSIILVVSNDGTNSRILQRTKTLLESSSKTLSGFVLNRVDRLTDAYSDYYDYYGHTNEQGYAEEAGGEV